MKMLNKISKIIIVFIFVFSFFITDCWALNKMYLSVVKSKVSKEFNNQGYIEKEIINFDKMNGEVKIKLTINNFKKDENQQQIYTNTEVYVLVSLSNTQDKYINSIKTLVEKILDLNKNTKVGIIGVMGPIRDVTYNDDGDAIIGSADQSSILGSADNASLILNPSSDVEEIKNALTNMNSSKTKYYSNLQAAIRLANNSFSKNVNKILISLYDDVPSVCIGEKNMVSYGGLTGFSSIEQAVKAKHDSIATKTKDEILNLKAKNISFILLRPGDTSYDEKWYNHETGKKELDFDGSPYVQKLYGTIDNPTYGKIHTYSEETIDTVIKEYIYQDIENIVSSNISNILVKDYFVSDTLQNFDYIFEEASEGDTTKEINNNVLEWNVDNLMGNSSISLIYTLKAKDMNNSEINNKIFDTNDKVVISYDDAEGNNHEVVLDDSPQIRLDLDKVENPATLAKNIFYILVPIICLLGLYIFYKTYNKLKYDKESR